MLIKRIFKTLLHLIISVFLTVITQVGGVIYLISILIISRKSSRFRFKRSVLFVSLYLIITFLFVPNVAPHFGREKIKDSSTIVAHTFFTKLTNRNYVKPEMNIALQTISKAFQKKHNDIKLVYLDANFPFFDGFPLLPHLSHSDGKKIDISLVYETKSGVVVNKRKSISGYGFYEEPRKGDDDFNWICKKKGNWQYDFPKHLTFGKINKDLVFSEVATRNLILEIIKQPQVGKLFVEPHLKKRLNLKSSKIRFHGCQAVRHDFHIPIKNTILASFSFLENEIPCMKKLSITLLLLTASLFNVYSQDTNLEEKTRYSETELQPGESYVMDTIIDGQAYFKKEIPLANPDTTVRELEDDALAASIDEKWREELYSNSLFDTIYRSVTELTYDDVYYPELPTDTLKARLAELNARTPFNVEYNKSLESVIKSYLKNRRKSLTKLMAMSHYYFPMFEREMDNYNIPLEMKYLAIEISCHRGISLKAKSKI